MTVTHAYAVPFAPSFSQALISLELYRERKPWNTFAVFPYIAKKSCKRSYEYLLQSYI